MRDLEAKVALLSEIVDGRSPRVGSQTGPNHNIQTDSQEYTSLLYQQMERGLFPRQAELKTVITKSVHELITKPFHEKNPFERRLDELFIEYLPKEWISLDITQEDKNEWSSETSEV
jgi:hypothetical protein